MPAFARMTANGLVACTVVLLATARSVSGLDSIVPDAPMQAAIAQVPAAASAAELDAALAKLKASSGGDYEKLVPQLLYFSMRGTDVRDGMTAGVVIDRLQISKEQLLRAIVPYLDTNAPDLQRQLRNVLSAVDEIPKSQPPDFTRYAPLLRQHPDNPPPVLVAYMIDTAPDLALQTLADILITDAATRRALLDAAKRTGGAGLERVAQDKAWWVRLYAAIQLQREPTLRTPALVQRLGDDPNPTVRAAIREIVPR